MYYIHYKIHVLADNRGSQRYMLADHQGSSSTSLLTGR